MADRLSGAQKAAILLLTMEEEAAAEVLKNLNEDEIRAVTAHMARFQSITPQDVNRVASEFYRVAERARFLPESPETKVDYLRKILGRALGEERADEMVRGLVRRKPESPLERLTWHDPHTVAEFLSPEHPQVIAVILANLGDAALVQSILSELPLEMQEDVFTRLARLRTIPPEWLREIESSLGADLEAEAEPPAAQESPTMGPKRVARVLGNTNLPLQHTLFEQIRQRNPELAERVRRHLFTFADLLKLDNYAIQVVLKNVSGQDLVLALKLADEPMRRHFLKNMSAPAAERVEEAIAGLGPTAITHIEEAQQRIALAASALLDGGEIHPPLRRREAARRTPEKAPAGSELPEKD
ncbi:MAG: flagellar motor switch protein FliG [Deltaproteobacteria bacterium]|nr:flagellar motor switch protein FliG [Deltaproteobacteria bacterium]